MKKYLNKTVALLLMLVVFPMVSGFCFQGIDDFLNRIDGIEAASVIPTVEVDDVDMNHQSHQQHRVIALADTMATHHNSLLACCENDGDHFNITTAFTLTPSPDSVFLMPVMLSAVNRWPTESTAITSNPFLMISPPESSLIKKTVLRL